MYPFSVIACALWFVNFYYAQIRWFDRLKSGTYHLPTFDVHFDLKRDNNVFWEIHLVLGEFDPVDFEFTTWSVSQTWIYDPVK